MNRIMQLVDARLAAAGRPDPKARRATSAMAELELSFDTGHLTICNPYTLRCDSNVPVEFQNLMGNRVTDAYCDGDELTVVFEGRLYLSVSLREEDFIGPEAAVYTPLSGPAIVFGGGLPPA